MDTWDREELFTWIRAPLPETVFLLPRVRACLEQLGENGERLGIEDGGTLVGFYLRTARAVIVTNILRGDRLKRSAASLDSRPDTAAMSEQFHSIDREANGRLFVVGRVHRHPGSGPGQPSMTDRRAYKELSEEGDLEGMLCPIITTSPNFEITGWFYTPEEGGLGNLQRIPVEPLGEADFLSLFEEMEGVTQQAAREILAASRRDVAGILPLAEEDPRVPLSVSSLLPGEKPLPYPVLLATSAEDDEPSPGLRSRIPTPARVASLAAGLLLCVGLLLASHSQLRSAQALAIASAQQGQLISDLQGRTRDLARDLSSLLESVRLPGGAPGAHGTRPALQRAGVEALERLDDLILLVASDLSGSLVDGDPYLRDQLRDVAEELYVLRSTFDDILASRAEGGALSQ